MIDAGINYAILLVMTGKQLRQIRERMKMGRVEFGALVDMTAGHIKNMENGSAVITERTERFLLLLTKDPDLVTKIQDAG